MLLKWNFFQSMSKSEYKLSEFLYALQSPNTNQIAFHSRIAVMKGISNVKFMTENILAVG